MKFNFKNTTYDYVEACRIGVRRKLNLLMIIAYILLGLYYIIKHIRLLNFIFAFACFVIVIFFVVLSIISSNKKPYRDIEKNSNLKNFFIKEKHASIDSNKIILSWENNIKEVKFDNIMKVIEKNNKIYIYTYKYSIIIVIPVSAFKDINEKNNFINSIKR